MKSALIPRSNAGDIFSLFDDFFKSPSDFENNMAESVFTRSFASFPPYNVKVDKDTKNLRLEIALAGYSEEDIELNFSNDRLNISSVKSEETEDSYTYFKKGIKSSSFEVSYVIPFSKYDVDNASATFKDGILTVSIPASDRMKPKRLQITHI